MYALAALLTETDEQQRQHKRTEWADFNGLTSLTSLESGRQPSVELRNEKPYTEARKSLTRNDNIQLQ